MKIIQVFDPALCCSTGVCGVDVDQQLVDFSADVDWAKQQGAQIERFNLAQQPTAFAENAVVKEFLERSGAEALPLILVDGEVALAGRYPSRAELAEWLGLAAASSIFTEQVAELVAIGAAIAANCEPCFKYHYDQARKLGVSNTDMRRAVDLAQMVKDTPARAMGYPGSQGSAVSINVAHMIDEEIRSIIDRNYQRAEIILQENIDILHKMAEALMKWETLDRQQIEDLMAGRDARPPQDGNDHQGRQPNSDTKGQKKAEPEAAQTAADKPAEQI